MVGGFPPRDYDLPDIGFYQIYTTSYEFPPVEQATDPIRRQ